MEPTSLLYYLGLITKRVIGHDIGALRLIGFTLYRRTTDVRVSASVLARLMVGDNYILVRNEHRQEVFGPFGGVVKFDQPALERLDQFDFKPEYHRAPDDMARDIRGYVSRRNTFDFKEWYNSNADREDAYECLRRELKEELAEVGLSYQQSLIDGLSWRRVRQVEEGPKGAVGRDYKQYRIFDVYDLRSTTIEAQQILELVGNAADDPNNKSVIAVNSAEIKKGRSRDGYQIGQHVAYLIGSRQLRPEPPAF